MLADKPIRICKTVCHLAHWQITRKLYKLYWPLSKFLIQSHNSSIIVFAMYELCIDVHLVYWVHHVFVKEKGKATTKAEAKVEAKAGTRAGDRDGDKHRDEVRDGDGNVYLK